MYDNKNGTSINSEVDKKNKHKLKQMFLDFSIELLKTEPKITSTFSLIVFVESWVEEKFNKDNWSDT